jgi:uroporphyrinogen decarboxylase
MITESFSHIPFHKAAPDADECIRLLLHPTPGSRVPLVEYIVDDQIMRPVLEELMHRPWVPFGENAGPSRGYLDNLIAFWHGMGYDFVRYELALPFPASKTLIADAAPGSTKDRAWQDEHHGMITTWEEFEAYPWPKVEDFDFTPLEYLNDNLPDGMGMISSHGGGVFEHLSWIMSLEGLCLALHEDTTLVEAVANRLGELMLGFYRHLLDLDRLIAVFPGDDMGYRTATMISPRDLRSYTLPWHKRFAAMAHDHGVPYFLHSCGNLSAIIDDLITDVCIDGKHSFEDAIIPVEEFQRSVGGRIAALGGVDINILSGGTPLQVRQRVRHLIEQCGSVGRYAIGSGNSVPSYVPVNNYIAMIDETHATNTR